MKSILTLLTLSLVFVAAAKADDSTEQLVCKSSYDVVTADDSLSAKGPTLVSPVTTDSTGAQVAGGSKDKTHWGVGFSVAYSSRSARVTISVTNAAGVNTTAVGYISTDIESELQMQLDPTTRMHVVCILKK